VQHYNVPHVFLPEKKKNVGAVSYKNISLYPKMANVEATFKNLHQDLLDGCKEGDQKAQFQIYKLYYKAMYNTSVRIVSNTMEAEDVMQESFLAAFEKIDTYSGTVSFGAWLKKIVVNRSLDALNRRKAVFEDIESHAEIKDESPEESFRNEEIDIRVGAVKDAIEKLPDGYRVILSLYLLEGYDHDEIADILKINSSTSRSQLSRAKQRLIGELKKYENY
jgi:RNA polymerase sigma factor (sigma-70 family)